MNKAASSSTPFSMYGLVYYFLKLGALGFGGPIALVAFMRRDLVEERGWISPEEYENGLALSQLAPGPLAAQLAIYLGWARGGVFGATMVAFAFTIPSFLIVVGLACLYIEFSGLPWIQSLFYGVGAAVISIIILGSHKLLKKTLGSDKFFWGLSVLSAIITAWTESEVIWVFLISGIIAIFLKAPPSFLRPSQTLSLLPVWLLTGIHSTPVTKATLINILVFFAKSGAFVFGSGLAIVPFLHSGAVQEYGWLNEQQFIDAVAIAMISPGPVVITVAFIGYLTAGFTGACLAAFGVFLPCYLLVILPAPHYHKLSHIPQVKAFINGVTAAAVGTIAGAAYVLGKRAIVDVYTAVICLAALILLLTVKKLPEHFVIVAAGIIGLLIKGIN